MLRLEPNKGKAFLWDMRLLGKAAKLYVSNARQARGVTCSSAFAQAVGEVFLRKGSVPQNDEPKAAKTLSKAPKNSFRHRDFVICRLSLANLFRRSRKTSEESPVRFPWAESYALAAAQSLNRTCKSAAPKSAATRVMKSGLEIAFRIGQRINTCEFWLGFGFGIATRLLTRAMMLDAFPPSPDHATAFGISASAIAGVAAGVVACLVRALYRNAQRKPGAPKEAYCSRLLFESALMGLLGGIFGGCATNFGTLLTRSSAFAVGTATGATASIVHAVMKENWRHKDGGLGWEKFAFQSAVFSLAGGVLGIVSSDLFGSTSSAAASTPVGGADSILYINSPPDRPEFCGTDQCWLPPRMLEPPQRAAIPAMPVVPALPAEEVIRITVPEHHAPAHHPPKAPCAAKHPVIPKKETLCYPEKHVKHVKHIKHLKAKEPTEIIIRRTIIPAPIPVPPPEAVTPQGVPMHSFAPIEIPPRGEMPAREMPPMREPPPRGFNPCETGMCGDEPCYDSGAINLKGPCADPRMPCVERVSFNEDGEATKAVLEPASNWISRPYYEMERSPEEMRRTNWNTREQGNFIPARGSEGTGQLSLVVPVVNNRTLTLASLNPAPV
ncbi:MAG: hypothetical protein PHW76_07990 [Alphaproteobacteria bacterium]|nr:hypothetical protein [Alphaproteobacteria bacterium]